MTLPVAILAGGRAMRLGELVRETPKSLIEVAGQPFIAHQLALLRAQGFTDVVVCIGHLGAAIESAVGDGSRYGVRVRYSRDGAAPLGTGGALRHALPLLGDAFLVLYGDSYLECDYQVVERAFLTSGKPALLTVFRNDNRWDRSNILCTDGRIVRYSKTQRTPDMRHIDYGLAAIRADALSSYRDGESLDLMAFYQDLLARNELGAYEVHTRFFEIGTPVGLAETQAHLASGRTVSYAHQPLD